jgi:hypothetical protein
VNHGGHKKRNGYQLHLENYQAALQTMSETIGYLVTSNEGTVIGYYSWGLGLLSNPEKVTAYRVGVTGLSFIGYLVTSNLGWNKNLERNLVAPSAKDPLYNSNVYEDEAGIAAKAKTTPPIASDPLADLNVYQDQIDEDFL